MAPWPDRVDSHRLRGPPSPSSPHPPTNPAALFTNPARPSEFEVLDSSQLQASSSDDDGGTERLHPPPRPTRPSHARSMSNPFPSLFTARKKPSPPPGHDRYESDSNEDGTHMSKIKGKSIPRTRGHGQGPGSRDFVTGHCMTCNSLVRWPRGLLVFKCTICLTINDLQPKLPSDDKDRATPPDGSSSYPRRPPPPCKSWSASTCTCHVDMVY
jgi:E3 ubiquitin-protein ligase HECTD2